jgi:hypothetical protein
MDFSEFLISLKNANQVNTEALQCAAIILRRAQELPVNQRPLMLDIVKKLISVRGQENSVDASNVFPPR